MAGKKLTLSVHRTPIMTVTRSGIDKSRLVYFILANRTLKYKYGDSRIAYIGTTKNGLSRISQSAATHAETVLGLHGITSFDVHLVTCKPKPGVKTWHILERAILLEFRAIYGEIPHCNSDGSKFKEMKEFETFARERVRKIIKELGEN